jgi:hypothetical protein
MILYPWVRVFSKVNGFILLKYGCSGFLMKIEDDEV